MPNFQWRDAYGMNWTLTSSEPEVIKLWLLERARYAVSANASVWEQRLIIYPMPLDATGTTDWPVGGGKPDVEYVIQADGLVRLAHLMEEFALKEQIRSNEMAGAEWCDFANHPFKAGSEGTIRTQRKAKDGQQAQEYVLCPECAAEIGLNPDFEAPETPFQRKAAIEAAARPTGGKQLR